MSGAAIFCDTETTGIESPDVIELAYSAPFATPKSDPSGPPQLFRFKPTKPIEVGAMATHHIIPDDLVDCPVWSPAQFQVPDGVEYFVGHAIDFDWEALGKPNVKRICTLALAKKVWPLIDNHKLVTLIYHIYPPAMARNFVKGAHDALVDIGLCARVLFALLSAYPAVETWEDLWKASEIARIPERFDFGKYGPKDGQAGELISVVRQMDRGYIGWLLNNHDKCKTDPYWRKALTQ